MKTPSELLSDRIIHLLNSKDFKTRNLNLAISGGSSPDTLFSLWSDKYSKLIDWNRVNVFWVDERCVPPSSAESNYGRAYLGFIKNINIPSANIFRIRGEIDPSVASNEYEELILSKLESSSGFDLVLLGVGDDGHTSSVFPGQSELYKSDRFYKTSVNPYNGLYRISLTLSGILKSGEIAFYLNGPSKLPIFQIMNSNTTDNLLPAEFIIKNRKGTYVYWENAPEVAFSKLNSIFVI
jgi:6-phosphogluconolactonase